MKSFFTSLFEPQYTPAAPSLPQDFAKAFKPADIRGIYPTELNEEVAYRIARAFVARYAISSVVLGRDMRVSSPSLHQAIISGITDQGADVCDIGLVDTPAIYYASGRYDSYGIMITASHNPKEYNGIKLVKPGAIPLTEDDGLGDIRTMVTENAFSSHAKGSVSKKDIFSEYTTYIQQLVHIQSSRKIRVVVDAGNGMATSLAPILKNEPSLTMIPLFFKLDGTFPNRGSNPTVEKNIGPIIAKIREEKPDFGVAFDGDVDRVAFFDENGKPINSAVIGSLIVKNILSKQQGGSIVYTNFTSKSFFETIKKYGGTPIREKVGHSFIKNKMREVDAPFSCEHSAHFFFKENYYADSGILAFLRVLEEFSLPEHDGKTFSELVREFNTYHQTEELLIPVRDKDAVIDTIQKIYAPKNPLQIDMFDGLYVEFPEYWFCLRKSVTEDVLNLVVEAPEESTVERVVKEVQDAISRCQ